MAAVGSDALLVICFIRCSLHSHINKLKKKKNTVVNSLSPTLFHDNFNVYQFFYFRKSHNTSCLPLKILHSNCIRFLLGHEDDPREIENNGYAKLFIFYFILLFFFFFLGGGGGAVEDDQRGKKSVVVKCERALLPFYFLVQQRCYKHQWITK